MKRENKIPCLICGEAYTLEDMGSYFRFPADTPDILTVDVDHPYRKGDKIVQQTSAVGVCTPCQRAVLSVRRANNINAKEGGRSE